MSDEERSAAAWWYEGLPEDMKREVMEAYRGEVERKGGDGDRAREPAA